ncbi:MAG TPA: hypothetical protein VHZ07_05740 [Bryobacteraceae bacterium]|nr:hypothetical protein [Bryobacteraceae bacterium]
MRCQVEDRPTAQTLIGFVFSSQGIRAGKPYLLGENRILGSFFQLLNQYVSRFADLRHRRIAPHIDQQRRTAWPQHARISSSALTGSVKFLNAARQTTKSTLAVSTRTCNPRFASSIARNPGPAGCSVVPRRHGLGLTDIQTIHMPQLYGPSTPTGLYKGVESETRRRSLDST